MSVVGISSKVVYVIEKSHIATIVQLIFLAVNLTWIKKTVGLLSVLDRITHYSPRNFSVMRGQLTLSLVLLPLLYLLLLYSSVLAALIEEKIKREKRLSGVLPMK
jgi:hypothetical protein